MVADTDHTLTSLTSTGSEPLIPDTTVGVQLGEPDEMLAPFDGPTNGENIEQVRKFHERAMMEFEQSREGYVTRHKRCACRLFRAVRFAKPQIERRYLIWTTRLRRGAELTSLALMVIWFGLLVATSYKDIVSNPSVVLPCFAVLAALHGLMYVLIAFNDRLPWRLFQYYGALNAWLATSILIATLLVYSACTPWLSMANCSDLNAGKMSGVALFEIIILQIVVGIGLCAQVTVLLAANVVFLVLNVWNLIRFDTAARDTSLLLLVFALFATLVLLQTYSNHVHRRFEFHMLLSMSNQLRTIRDHSKALAAAQEATMSAQNEAVKANTAKETHQAIMGYTCHELRNPLHGIRGCLDGLLEKLEPGSQVTQADLFSLRLIESACAQMCQVTDDVLDLNKLQSGRLKLRFQSVDVREMLHRIIDQFNTGPASACPVRAQIADSVPAFMETDGLRLTQVLTNGLSNALKHASPNTSVVVECFPSMHNDMDTITVEIRNRGAGLRGLDAGKLFQPYERGLDDASGIPGVGLGLPISRMLVSMMGGEIGLEDRPPDNTVYWFWLPLTRVSATGAPALLPAPLQLLVSGDSSTKSGVLLGSSAAAEAASDEASLVVSPAHSQKRITLDNPWVFWGSSREAGVASSVVLVVDDQDLNRRLLSHMLQRFGLQTAQLSDGDEITTWLEESAAPMICFLDIHMVRSDGRDVARQLRSAGVTWPIIATTGNIGDAEIDSYSAAGFDGVLGKPFTAVHVKDLLVAAGIL